MLAKAKTYTNDTDIILHVFFSSSSSVSSLLQYKLKLWNNFCFSIYILTEAITRATYTHKTWNELETNIHLNWTVRDLWFIIIWCAN